MNLPSTVRTSFIAALSLCLVGLPRLASAADPGSDLAAKMRAKENGSSFVRIRMQGGSGDSGGLQVQIKSRQSGSGGDVIYQILFPKERKGESVLLHRAGEKFSGTAFTLPNAARPIGAGDMSQPLFGTDLSYEDVIDSAFAWRQQAIVGTEDVDGNPCQILESKPDSHGSSYASVKTWIDPRRMVPLRIEKYDGSGKVVRRINVTRILLNGGDSLPADLKVYGPRGSVTQITGSGIKRGVTYADTDFTPEGLKQLNAPANSPE
jgi:hypothetical protein